MAITYTVRVNELGENLSNYSVSADVQDDTKPIGHQVETVSVISAKLDTPERKKAVWDNLKSQYLAKVSKVDVVGGLEIEVKTYLDKG